MRVGVVNGMGLLHICFRMGGQGVPQMRLRTALGRIISSTEASPCLDRGAGVTWLEAWGHWQANVEYGERGHWRRVDMTRWP